MTDGPVETVLQGMTDRPVETVLQGMTDGPVETVLQGMTDRLVETVLQGMTDGPVETGTCCRVEMNVGNTEVMRISRQTDRHSQYGLSLIKKTTHECGIFQLFG